MVVALRKESVDRNYSIHIFLRRRTVALRKESVDRNFPTIEYNKDNPRSLSARRAWIEMMQFVPITTSDVSLSARRAWIEMECTRLHPSPADRSLSARRAWIEIESCFCFPLLYLSLSARRAWIEIAGATVGAGLAATSLSARRAWIEMIYFALNIRPLSRRSPQGERG